MITIVALFALVASAGAVSHDESVIEKRTIVMLGASGQGKSFLGNLMLHAGKGCKQSANSCDPLFADEEDEENNECIVCKFEAGSDPCSVTNETRALTGIVEWKSRNKKGELLDEQITKKLNLTVIDTPGMADTSGRSIEFLDRILSSLSKIHPDLVLFVDKGARNKLLESTTNLMRFAFHGRLSPLNSIAVLNEWPTKGKLSSELKPEEQSAIRKECMEKASNVNDQSQLKKCVAERLEKIWIDRKMSAARTNFFDHLIDPHHPDKERLIPFYQAFAVHPGNKPNGIPDLLDIIENARAPVDMTGVHTFTAGEDLAKKQVNDCRNAVALWNKNVNKGDEKGYVDNLVRSLSNMMEKANDNLQTLGSTYTQKKDEHDKYTNSWFYWLVTEKTKRLQMARDAETARDEALAERQSADKLATFLFGMIVKLYPCQEKSGKQMMTCVNEANKENKCEATVFQHWKTNGESYTFSEGKYSFPDQKTPGWLDDSVSSILVLGDESCRATLYETKGYGGWKVTLGVGMYTLGAIVEKGGQNDGASSISVERLDKAFKDPEYECENGFEPFWRLKKYEDFRKEAKKATKPKCEAQTQRVEL